jgi:hypothetical protein
MPSKRLATRSGLSALRVLRALRLASECEVEPDKVKAIIATPAVLTLVLAIQAGANLFGSIRGGHFLV